MKSLDNILDKVLSLLSVLLYGGMTIVVLIQIAARYADNLTVSWTEEMTRLLFVFIIALGSGLSLKYGAYADVDILYERFPRPLQKVSYILNYVFILIFNVVAIVSGLNFIEVGKRALSPAMRIPMGYLHATIFIFGIVSAFYTVMKFIEFFKNPDKTIDDSISHLIVTEEEENVI